MPKASKQRVFGTSKPLIQKSLRWTSTGPSISPSSPTHSPKCIICHISLHGKSDSAIAQHTNACLDSGVSNSRQRHECPWYKRLPNTSFTVDAFAYGKIPDCFGYFLSHFHSDHYTQLSNTFDYGVIYCSQVTANLVEHHLRVNKNYIQVLPMNTRIEIQGITVYLLDANHCPGAVMFLFEIPTTTTKPLRYLHTGDFRAATNISLASILKEAPLDIVYLDTTYCNPRYRFPSQERAIEIVCQLVELLRNGKSIERIFNRQLSLESWFTFPNTKQTARALIVVGTYLIGKEKLVKCIAQKIGSKIYADVSKRKVFACMADQDLQNLLTNNPMLADVHVIRMGDLNSEFLSSLLVKYGPFFSEVVAIRPTVSQFFLSNKGWTYRNGTNAGSEFTMRDLTYLRLSSHVSLVGVPYSEHSSFEELKHFVQSLDIRNIIPTVNSQNAQKRLEMECIFESWKKRSTGPYEKSRFSYE